MSATPDPIPSADAASVGAMEMTIDELSAKAGTTVRTTRYYASLGLIPPPRRRGRVAYYGDPHLARLEMIRALQDHGFTLQAIERYLNSLPEGASSEQLALQRAMLTSWTTEPPARLDRSGLDDRAARTLSDVDIETLLAIGALESDGGEHYLVLPGLAVGLEMIDLDIPMTATMKATSAINRHMTELADELTEILRTEIVRPFRAEEHTAEEAVQMERTVSALRRVVLEGVIAGFQRAANQVIQRSLRRR